MIVVITTVATSADGEMLAETIVEARLAACVQVLPQMTSFYIWDGAVQREPEHLLLIKTTADRWDALHRLITDNHSYSVPEIVAVDAANVSGPYREWLEAAVRPD
ncbi:MAG: divalent-cation tolerance protein CutA [Chloracidobacterium sp.]|nr:divalent-cation tolerance protein CutA [Chloracidobacterium sp.]